ncbi:MAG: SDR family NAD(P)-dependent oxidoreductase [Acidimicrobiales bacterium]
MLPAPAPASTCLVTGASSGIGAEVARELARRGHGVTLVARREDRLKELAAAIAGTSGVRTEVLAADLTDESARGELAARIDGLGLSVEVLVNNAGFSTMGPVVRADRARELDMLRTNVEAVVDLCTIFTPGMVGRHRGAVLNTASTAAFQPLPGQAAYGATKAFVLSYSHALHAELKAEGVSVTALCPGPVATGFGQAAGLSDEEAEASLPKVMWLTAAEVARAGVDGLAQNRAVVIPGVANKLGAALGYLAPRALTLEILARRHPALQDPHRR